ncbi:amidase family protein [Micromonospora sp. CA-259024]|uniref:amidase family protein n=1 Tax=Micromonospora sp. CA-259024 TaxID=3239965 RepID=UPI003D8B198E
MQLSAVRCRWTQFKAVQGTPLLPTCSPHRARTGPPTDRELPAQCLGWHQRWLPQPHRSIGDYIVSPTLSVVSVRNALDGTTIGPTSVQGVTVNPLIGWCLTYLYNFTGHPAISIPAGLSSNGLPVGVQIAGRGWADRAVLAAAAVIERRRPWACLRGNCALSISHAGVRYLPDPAGLLSRRGTGAGSTPRPGGLVWSNLGDAGPPELCQNYRRCQTVARLAARHPPAPPQRKLIVSRAPLGAISWAAVGMFSGGLLPGATLLCSLG